MLSEVLHQLVSREGWEHRTTELGGASPSSPGRVPDPSSGCHSPSWTEHWGRIREMSLSSILEVCRAHGNKVLERQRGPGWMRALPYAMAGPPVDVQFYVVTIDTTGFCRIWINRQWVFFSLVPSHPNKPFLLSSYSALKLLWTYENSMQRMEWADCHGDKNGMFILIYCMASRLLAASVFFVKQLDCLFENMTGLALRLVFEPWLRLNK